MLSNDIRSEICEFIFISVFTNIKINIVILLENNLFWENNVYHFQFTSVYKKICLFFLLSTYHYKMHIE